MKEPEPVDVLGVMKEIRESIQRKRQQGVYTDEESEALAQQRLRSWAEQSLIDARLVEGLLGPGHEWNIAADYAITTTRRGVLARLLVLSKRLVRPFVRLYTDHLVKRQAQINLYLAHLVHSSIRESARQQVELRALKHRLATLEAAAASPSERGPRPGELGPPPAR